MIFDQVNLNDLGINERMLIQDYISKIKRNKIVKHQKLRNKVFVIWTFIFAILVFIFLSVTGFYYNSNGIWDIFPISWSKLSAINIQAWIILLFGLHCTFNFVDVCKFNGNQKSIINKTFFILGFFYLIYIWFFIGIFIDTMVVFDTTKLEYFYLLDVFNIKSIVSFSIILIFIRYYIIAFIIMSIIIIKIRYNVARNCENYLLNLQRLNSNRIYDFWYPMNYHIKEIVYDHIKQNNNALNNQPDTFDCDKESYAELEKHYAIYGKPEIKNNLDVVTTNPYDNQTVSTVESIDLHNDNTIPSNT